MGETESGHRSCSEHLSVELFVQQEQEMQGAIEQPVVSGFLTVGLGSFEVMMKMVCLDL